MEGKGTALLERIYGKIRNAPEMHHRLPGVYIAFYQGVRLDENGFTGLRGTEEYAIKDDLDILEFYNAHKGDDSQTLANAVLSNTKFWGEDLAAIAELCEEVAKGLDVIKTDGAYELMKQCLA